jgi:competence protein ComEC
MPALVWPPPRPDPGAAWVEVLDVGQGLAVLVRTAGHTLLYDTGPLYSAESNAGLRVVVPYLRATGVRQLDTLVVSHRDKDHAGGVTAVQAYLPVTRLLTSIPELGGEPCTVEQQWIWDGVGFAILNPDSADYALKSKKTNSMSCVLRISNANGSALLTADIEAADERALIARLPDMLRSEVLVVPHHGSNASSTTEFIAAVGAREAIFSAGYRNAFNHPRHDVLERYAASRQWRTDRDGAVRIVLAGPPEVSAWRKEHGRYWYGQ